ncbi:MAG: hypothetical protein IH862_04870 [Chloroflexi bacterium]|nr:hypothetical protein [Chloroflexota bacterium]
MERGSARGVNRISVVGGGVVGQATGIGFARLGHQVVFCDIDAGVRGPAPEPGLRGCFSAGYTPS